MHQPFVEDAILHYCKSAPGENYKDTEVQVILWLVIKTVELDTGACDLKL